MNASFATHPMSKETFVNGRFVFQVELLLYKQEKDQHLPVYFFKMASDLELRGITAIHGVWLFIFKDTTHDLDSWKNFIQRIIKWFKFRRLQRTWCFLLLFYLGLIDLRVPDTNINCVEICIGQMDLLHCSRMTVVYTFSKPRTIPLTATTVTISRAKLLVVPIPFTNNTRYRNTDISLLTSTPISHMIQVSTEVQLFASICRSWELQIANFQACRKYSHVKVIISDFRVEII